MREQGECVRQWRGKANERVYTEAAAEQRGFMSTANHVVSA